MTERLDMAHPHRDEDVSPRILFGVNRGNLRTIAGGISMASKFKRTLSAHVTAPTARRQDGWLKLAVRWIRWAQKACQLAGGK